MSVALDEHSYLMLYTEDSDPQKLLDPVGSLNALLKRATRFGVKRKEWKSVSVKTEVLSNHLRIVTYAPFDKKRAHLERKVPCFVCYQRPDADATVESSVVILRGSKINLAWTPRAKLLWWNSNRKIKKGFTKSGDDAAREDFYNWLSGCPIFVDAVSKSQLDALHSTVKYVRIDQLRIDGFWLVKNNDNTDLHMTVIGTIHIPFQTIVDELVKNKVDVDVSNDVYVYQFDVLCALDDRRCYSNPPRSLLQRRYVPVRDQELRFSLYDKRLRLTLNDSTDKRLSVIFLANKPEITPSLRSFIINGYRPSPN